MSESDKKPETARPVSAPAASKAELKTPEQWAPACGQVRRRSADETFSQLNGKPFDQIGQFLDAHEVAAVVHGWAQHAHHTGAPFQLSRADYEAALAAAMKTDAKGQPVPHAAALSPHAAPQFLAAAKGAR